MILIFAKKLNLMQKIEIKAEIYLKLVVKIIRIKK